MSAIDRAAIPEGWVTQKQYRHGTSPTDWRKRKLLKTPDEYKKILVRERHPHWPGRWRTIRRYVYLLEALQRVSREQAKAAKVGRFTCEWRKLRDSKSVFPDRIGRWLRATVAAKRLNVSESTIDAWCRPRQSKPDKHGRRGGCPYLPNYRALQGRCRKKLGASKLYVLASDVDQIAIHVGALNKATIAGVSIDL
jgi:hypothetical protein